MQPIEILISAMMLALLLAFLALALRMRGVALRVRERIEASDPARYRRLFPQRATQVRTVAPAISDLIRFARTAEADELPGMVELKRHILRLRTIGFCLLALLAGVTLAALGRG